MVNEFFEILQIQGFFKDMNATCKVFNIRKPVLQVLTALKNHIKVLKLVTKLL